MAMTDSTPEAHQDSAAGSPDDDRAVRLPEAFAKRLSEILAPADFDSALHSFGAPRAASLRINTLVHDPEAVVEELTNLDLDMQQIDWLPYAYTVPAYKRAPLLSSTAYSRCAVYVQNASSMIPVAVLDPQPGEEILDLAAAPGSKTHQIACALQNAGRVTAVEVVRTRYYKLRDNMDALGAHCVRPFFQDGTRTWRYRPEFFDRVLLDAPCSSEGRFRLDDPDSLRYWSRGKVAEVSRKQRRLLYSAIRCLKPGGTLVYSTCSFSPEENEAVVHKLVTKFGGAVRLTPIDLELPQFRPALRSWQGREFSDALQHARRVVPDGVMDGFFVCRMEKVESTSD